MNLDALLDRDADPASPTPVQAILRRHAAGHIHALEEAVT
jgi:hypothetical protein